MTYVPMCGGILFALNVNVASQKKTSHLSPLEFVNYDFHKLKVFRYYHHKLSARCADVDKMLESDSEINFGCTQLVRDILINHFRPFQDRRNRRGPQPVI